MLNKKINEQTYFQKLISGFNIFSGFISLFILLMIFIFVIGGGLYELISIILASPNYPYCIKPVENFILVPFTIIILTYLLIKFCEFLGSENQRKNNGK